jgi:hypothetical protein
VRRARGDHCRHASARAALVGARRLLLGAHVATLEPRLQGVGERGLRLLAPAPRAVAAHVGRQRHRVLGKAQQRVQRDERAEREHDGEQQRHLDPPVRVGDLHVALVEARGNGERRRPGEHHQQPQERPHPVDRSRRAL